MSTAEFSATALFIKSYTYWTLTVCSRFVEQ